MPARPSIKPGERIYAIGDVHGRLDLLGDLMERIREDGAARGRMRTTIVQLGDLIDRGPSSAELVSKFMNFTALSPQVVVLKGNHEEAMVEALEGDLCVLSIWLEMGGDVTLESWGLDPKFIARQQLAELVDVARRSVPDEVLVWLAGLPLSYRSGDFLFVHAGVRPGVSLAEQQAEDLLWIRGDFIDSTAEHGAVIVHGHSTVHDGPVIRANRIGLDTGAYRTGQLTALGIQGSDTWTLATG